MQTTIQLNRILNIDKKDWSSYKLHIAGWNGSEQPLDVFVRSFDEWMEWNRWRGNKDDFPREYILSVITDYHKRNRYLFGGIFRVVGQHDDWSDTEIGYDLEVVEEYESLIGRLEINFERYQGMRGRAFRLESYMEEMTVSRITEEPYAGIDFPGYDNVCIDYADLAQIVHRQKQDWKVALENMKGVYVITDKSNGKKYVGSAYGQSGIWSRWSEYVGSGHGNNDELSELISKHGIGYAAKHFQFALLELFPMKKEDDGIIERETYWKRVLLAHTHGYNRN